MRPTATGLLLAWSLTAIAAEEGDMVPVYAVSHGWHSGVLLPAAALDEALPALKVRFPGASYYEIGWGDQDYYQTEGFSFRLGWRALFASRGSVLHVVALPSPQLGLGVEQVPTCLAPADYAALASAVAASFVLDAQGHPVTSGSGRYGDSQFFQARGRFSWRYTCNHWTADVFRAGGVPLPGRTWTARSVLRGVAQSSEACYEWP